MNMLTSQEINSLEEPAKERPSSKKLFMELCEKASTEYSRFPIIKPYLEEIKEKIECEEWENVFSLLDELEELFDLDLTSLKF